MLDNYCRHLGNNYLEQWIKINISTAPSTTQIHVKHPLETTPNGQTNHFLFVYHGGFQPEWKSLLFTLGGICSLQTPKKHPLVLSGLGLSWQFSGTLGTWHTVPATTALECARESGVKWDSCNKEEYQEHSGYFCGERVLNDMQKMEVHVIH